MCVVRVVAVTAAALALQLLVPPAARAQHAVATLELSAQKHDKQRGRGQPHPRRAGPQVHRNATPQILRGPQRVITESGRAIHRGVNWTARSVLRVGPGPRVVVRGAPPRYWNGWRRPARIVIYRGPRRIWVGTGWRTLVPAVALGTFAVGAATYYADGYVPMPANVCTGPTADSCQLRWQQVPVEEGGSEFQCVQYCAQRDRQVGEVQLPDQPAPRAGAPMPPQQQAQAPAQRTGCEVTIYSDAEFKGSAAPTEEDQSDLSGDGWKDQIASVEIKSGTWDFFTGGEFDGEMMRLTPGRYPSLDAKWSRHIGSFMCSAPAGS